MNRSKRRVIFAAAVCVACLVATVAFAQSRRNVKYGGMNDTAFSGQRWQYASLRFRVTENKWTWRSPDETIAGDKFEIYQKLGGMQRPSGDLWYGEILNLAGQVGWEVVSVLDRDQGTEVWMKRQTR